MLYQKSRFAGPAPQTDIHKYPDTFKDLCESNRKDAFLSTSFNHFVVLRSRIFADCVFYRTNPRRQNFLHVYTELKQEL